MRYGPASLKQYLWDSEYARGKWRCLESMPEDCVYSAVERHTAGGALLDLGCGPGAVREGLAPGSFHWYTGVDLSDVAIRKARRATANSRHSSSDAISEFLHSDIESFQPNRSYDTILFGDSIYYLPEDRVLQVLERYAKHLSDRGVFIARMVEVLPQWFVRSHSADSGGGGNARRKAIVATILDHFNVVDIQLYDYNSQSSICVIVFRPKLATHLASEPAVQLLEASKALD